MTLNTRESVSEEKWDELPIEAKTHRFSRTAFIYHIEENSYFCPMGKRLAAKGEQSSTRKNGTTVESIVYESMAVDCANCPLLARCVSPKRKTRRLARMKGAAVLDRLEERMTSAESRAIYKRRSTLAESPFARIKSQFGIRRFLSRGLDKVRIEWQWICSAYNINLLARLLKQKRLSLHDVPSSAYNTNILNTWVSFSECPA